MILANLIWGLILVGVLLIGFAGWLFHKASWFLRMENQILNEKNKDTHRTLLYNIAHDVSNPLQNVLLILENMSQYSIDDEARWRQDLLVIGSEIRHLKKLTEHAKLLAILENPGAIEWARESIDLVAEIEGVIISQDEAAQQSGVNLVYQGPQRSPKIFGNREQLKEVLINLIENGIKYGKSNLMVTLNADQNTIHIAIADDGNGIPQNQLDRIWEVAYQFRDDQTRQIQGTGLGLAIVKRIIEKHNGSVNVESELSKGSTFTIMLPVYIPK